MFDLIIRNAIVTTADSTYPADIGITGGTIAALGTIPDDAPAREVVDVEGKHVIPGVIDTHVHIGWPDWDWEQDCVATTRAAAAGGVTTVMLMEGDTRPMARSVAERTEQFERSACVDGTFHEVVYTPEHVDEIVGMATSGGVASFKFFIPYRGSEVVPPQIGIDDGIIYQGFEQIGRLAEPALALFHPENIEIFFRIKERMLARGITDGFTWNDTRPSVCEIETIRRCVAFAKATGCALYVVHMTTKESQEEIERARAEGVTIYGETCPQYLTLSCDEADPVLSKVNPPIRTREDCEGLWRALRCGVISTVGSDHAACATKHKRDLWGATVGFAGVQTLLPVMLTEGVAAGRLSLNQLVACTSTNAARIFGIYPKKGAIQVGSDADLTVLDLDKRVTCHARDLYHISDFTPFEGRTFVGMPVATYVRGNLVACDGKVLGEPGGGRIVPTRAELRGNGA